MYCASIDAMMATTPLVALDIPQFACHGVTLWLKREEMRHPLWGGNKWFKLQGHLQRAAGRTLLGFGGAWSNHLHALAALGRAQGQETVGVVRGERLTPMLADCQAMGMRLIAVGYGAYRQRHDPEWQRQLLIHHGLQGAYVIPEGGNGAEGLSGFSQLADELWLQAPENAVYAVAMGTGCTLAGLAIHLPSGCRVWGFPVLPLPGIEQELPPTRATCRVWHGRVDRDYGQLTPELALFLQKFELAHSIALDPVYTVKLMWALYEMAERGELQGIRDVVALHSGGLQGRRGAGLPWESHHLGLGDNAAALQEGSANRPA